MMELSELDFRVLAPLACVASGSLIVLLLEACFLGRIAGWLLAATSGLVLASAGAFAGLAFAEGVDSAFNSAHPMLVLDPLSSLAIAILSLGALLSVGVAARRRRAIRCAEPGRRPFVG